MELSIAHFLFIKMVILNKNNHIKITFIWWFDSMVFHWEFNFYIWNRVCLVMIWWFDSMVFPWGFNFYIWNQKYIIIRSEILQLCRWNNHNYNSSTCLLLKLYKIIKALMSHAYTWSILSVLLDTWFSSANYGINCQIEGHCMGRGNHPSQFPANVGSHIILGQPPLAAPCLHPL